MRGLLLWLSVPAVAIAGDNIGYEASLRTEVQARYLSQTSNVPVPVGLFPTLTVLRRFPQTTFSLTYSPQLLIGGNGPASTPTLLHQGRFLAEYRIAADRRFVFIEQASYGTLDFLSLSNQPSSPTGPAPRFQPLPSFTPIPYGNSTTQGTLEWGFDKRLRGTLDLFYTYGGGLDAGTALLPIQRQAQGTVSLAYALTRTHSLTTAASVSQVSFSNGPISSVAQATEAWRFRPDRRSELLLNLGASGIQSQLNRSSPPSLLFFPAGQFSYRTQLQTSGERVDFDVLTSLGPYMDWISGVAYERLEANAGFRWTSKSERWNVAARLRGALTVASSVPSPNQALAATELSATYAPRSDLRVEAGSRVLWQRIPQFGPQPFYEWLTYVSLTVTAKGIL